MEKFGLFVNSLWSKLFYVATKTPAPYILLLTGSLMLLSYSFSFDSVLDQRQDWPEEMNKSFRNLDIGEEAAVNYRSVSITDAAALCEGQEVMVTYLGHAIDFVCRSSDDNYWIMIHDVMVTSPEPLEFREWMLVVKDRQLVYVSRQAMFLTMSSLVALFTAIFAVCMLLGMTGDFLLKELQRRKIIS